MDDCCHTFAIYIITLSIQYGILIYTVISLCCCIFFSGNALLRRLVRIGVLDEGKMKLDYVLGLKLEDFLERRLQTQVFKLGLAKSIHHARVLIRQRHIRLILKAFSIFFEKAKIIKYYVPAFQNLLCRNNELQFLQTLHFIDVKHFRNFSISWRNWPCVAAEESDIFEYEIKISVRPLLNPVWL